VVQPDGKIVATGYFGNTELWYVMLLVRFEADGSPDTSFGLDGIVKYNYGNVDDEGEDLVLMPDGSILVCGVTVTQTYNYSALLAKFTPDGDLDITFGNEGTVKEDQANFDFASNVALMADGKISIAGSSGVGPPSGFDLSVWKYMPDGTRDNSFGNNGLAHHVISGYYTMIYAMAVQADGKILIGGQARTTNNQNYFFTARLENDLSTGITDSSGSLEAQVFPNPATPGSMVTMQLSGSISPSAEISLYASDGRMVGSFAAGQFDRNEIGLSFQIPTDLAPGMYQLALQRSGTRLTSKILVTP
jgi:uncharacterized delta-60 repeat protein